MRDQFGNIYRYQETYSFGAAAQSSMAMAQNSMAMAQQSANNMAVSMHNFGAQLEMQAARNAIYNQCMAERGWTQDAQQAQQAHAQRQNMLETQTAQPHQRAAEQGNAKASSLQNALVGTWKNPDGGSEIEFRNDGAYIERLDGRSTYQPTEPSCRFQHSINGYAWERPCQA
jgi:hypothetical protein